MNKHLVASVLIMLSPLAAFAQEAESPAALAVAKLKSSYETSLHELLAKYIKAGDLASVANVAAELKKLNPEFPEVEQGGDLVGYWDWKYNNKVVLAASGLAVCNGKDFGIWRWTDEEHGKAEVKWYNGYIDTATLSPDKKKVHIVNNLEVRFVADRIETKKPKG
jgi:hypothetical protein